MGLSRALLGFILGTSVVPFLPFYVGVSLLKLNSRKRVPLLSRAGEPSIGLCRVRIRLIMVT